MNNCYSKLGCRQANLAHILQIPNQVRNDGLFMLWASKYMQINSSWLMLKASSE